MKVYNALAMMRGRKVGQGELLVLIPRCLSKATLDGVLGVAGRYGVPVFVATRGQLARRVIRERRPRAVVAVACERDMVSGLHDVAGKIPVLGPHHDLAIGPVQGCFDRSGSVGGVGPRLRGVTPENSDLFTGGRSNAWGLTARRPLVSRRLSLGLWWARRNLCTRRPSNASTFRAVGWSGATWRSSSRSGKEGSAEGW